MTDNKIIGFALPILSLSAMAAMAIYSDMEIEAIHNELKAYKVYYRDAEGVLYHANTDSVPCTIYNRYLNAVAGVAAWQEDEP